MARLVEKHKISGSKGNPPSPSFLMEETDRKVRESYRLFIKPIFDKVLQEGPIQPNVGWGRLGSVDTTEKVCYYKPHNYRIYCDFNKSDFNIRPLKQTAIMKEATIESINYGAEIRFSNFKGCTITVKKKQIEIRNNLDDWHIIKMGQKAKAQITEIIEKEDNICLSVLKDFMNCYGGTSELKILNRFSENKIMHEDKIDKIPTMQKFYTDVVKKVYNENNIEFSDPAYTSNYIVNRSIEDIAPLISSHLQKLSNHIRCLNPLRTLRSEVKDLNDVFKHRDLIESMSQAERQEFSGWIFERFGTYAT